MNFIKVYKTHESLILVTITKENVKEFFKKLKNKE